ncbi:hypothetical protein MD484_g7655, partial [Candolleomyces efflorescens]
MSSKPYRDSQEPFRFSRRHSPDSISLGSRYSDPFDDANVNGSTATLVPTVTQDASENPRPLPERSRPSAPRGPRKKESVASSLGTLALSAEDDDDEDGKGAVDLFPSPTHKLPASDKKDLSEDGSEEGKAPTSRADRHLSNLYSLYRRDTGTHLNSRLSYLPRFQQGQNHHQRNDSQATLVSNASRLDIDLEKQQAFKLGFPLDKDLPEIPPTPTPRRVLRRAGICTGLCCFCFLILVAICAVSFMMLMVNANLANWGTREAVLPMGYIERQKVAAAAAKSLSSTVQPTNSL